MSEPREYRAIFPPLGLAIEGPILAEAWLDDHDELAVRILGKEPFTLTRGAARMVATLLETAAGPDDEPATPWALEHRAVNGRWIQHKP